MWSPSRTKEQNQEPRIHQWPGMTPYVHSLAETSQLVQITLSSVVPYQVPRNAAWQVRGMFLLMLDLLFPSIQALNFLSHSLSLSD